MSNEIGRIVASTVTATTARRAPDAGAASSGASSQASGSDRVTLTQEAKALQSAKHALSASPPVDTVRVESVKLSLSQGTYQIDATRVAAQMVSFEASLSAATAPTTPAADPAADDTSGPSMMVTDPAAEEAEVAPQPGANVQRTLELDPESGTVTRSLTVTRPDGSEFSREVSLTRTEDGLTRTASLDAGRGITRDSELHVDVQGGSYSREVVYGGALGGELNVQAKGQFDEGGVSRVIQFEGSREQPVE